MIFFIKISLKFIPKVSNDNIPELVQIFDTNPLSKSMMIILLMQIHLTRPQWVNP